MSEDIEATDDEPETAEAEVESAVLPEIKQIIGALLFTSQTPLTVKQIRNVFKRAAENAAEEMAENDTESPNAMALEFKAVSEADVAAAMEELSRDLVKNKTGMVLSEVSTGFRLQNDKACGIWIRQLLEKGKVSRLSKPALETLAICAYRQPCTRADIEAIRGVAVDGMIRNLLEMQLVKVVGRSELPGRPWLFGTTQLFMEHFGLKNLEELPGIQELKRQAIAEPAVKAEQGKEPPPDEDEQAEPAGEDGEAVDSSEEDLIAAEAEAALSEGAGVINWHDEDEDEFVDDDDDDDDDLEDEEEDI